MNTHVVFCRPQTLETEKEPPKHFLMCAEVNGLDNGKSEWKVERIWRTPQMFLKIFFVGFLKRCRMGNNFENGTMV